jgi:hypothetical protein
MFPPGPSNFGALRRIRVRIAPALFVVIAGLGLGSGRLAFAGAAAKRSSRSARVVTTTHTPPRHRAARRAVPRRTPNMPPGWTWPPSPQMVEDGERCLARLRALGVAFEPGPAKRKIATPVVIPGWELGGVKLVPLTRRRPLVVDCHFAEALASAGGPALRKLGVTELRFTSLYEYRFVKRKRALSRHAIGLAIDIFEVVSADGTVRRVPRHYRSRDGYLKAVERALRKTGYFRGPLTPGNDPRGHWDHFHLEARTPAERTRVPNA